MSNWKYFYLTFYILILPRIVISVNYTMKDLEVLAEEKNYQEFFAHALDIVPANRDESWKNMVEALGLDHLDSLASKTQLVDEDYKMVHKLSSWPIFKEDEFFRKKRDYIFLRELKSCFQQIPKIQNEKCLALMHRIGNDYKHDIIFYYDMVLALVPFNIGQDILWAYASKLTNDPFSEFYCAKPIFKDVILDQIFAHFSIPNKDNTNGIKDLNAKLHKDCIKVLKPTLEELALSQDKIIRKSAFKFLNSKNLLSPKITHQYYALNFLNDHLDTSSAIDSSIDALKFLAKDINEREAFIKLLNKFERYPDELFKDLKLMTQPHYKYNSTKIQSSNAQASAKIRMLNRYFPEYIQYYTKTCLEYLNADSAQKFPKGNPTPLCHQFFKSKIVSELIPPNYVEDYKKATFFMKN